jgi:hypothetical protein
MKKETPQKTEVQTLGSCGISFGIDRHINRVHRTSRENPASRLLPAGRLRPSSMVDHTPVVFAVSWENAVTVNLMGAWF